MQPNCVCPNCNRIFQPRIVSTLISVKEEGEKQALSRRACGREREFCHFRTPTVAKAFFSRAARTNFKLVSQLLRDILRDSTRKNIFCKRDLQKPRRARTKSRKTAINLEKSSWP
jgi:hypothetical protein